MQRVGFSFKIKNEFKDEYKKAHDEIWPDLVEAMNNGGIHNYSIYYDSDDGTLFNYLEVTGDFDKAMAELAKLGIAQKWWQYMDRFFDYNSFIFKFYP